jgi:putative transposase
MVRPLRAMVAGVPVHVIQRGHNREQVFYGADDAQTYLGWLDESAKRHGVTIHAYVLMPNHLHLLATPARAESITRMMQQVGTRYAMHLNGARDRTGGLWEGRYRACPIETERYFLACSRYIEMNPVRAGLAKTPHGFRWSSYRHNVGEKADPLISQHPIYRALGGNDAARAKAYRALFDEVMGETTLAAIRTATNGGLPLGGAEFVAALGRTLGRSFERRRRGRPPKPRLVPGKQRPAAPKPKSKSKIGNTKRRRK